MYFFLYYFLVLPTFFGRLDMYMYVYTCVPVAVWDSAAALPADNFVSFGRLPRWLRGWERTRPVIATTRTITSCPSMCLDDVPRGYIYIYTQAVNKTNTFLPLYMYPHLDVHSRMNGR